MCYRDRLEAVLTAADFGGPALEGCNENLVLTKPSVISTVHEAYLKAGADIIETTVLAQPRLFWPIWFCG